jgi:hypothetical protein
MSPTPQGGAEDAQGAGRQYFRWPDASGGAAWSEAVNGPATVLPILWLTLALSAVSPVAIAADEDLACTNDNSSSILVHIEIGRNLAIVDNALETKSNVYAFGSSLHWIDTTSKSNGFISYWLDRISGKLTKTFYKLDSPTIAAAEADYVCTKAVLPNF